MVKAVQQRAIETRARLLDVAGQLVRDGGYEALRIDEVVARAGVAKGTFFAHFRDKDTLMDQMIGARIDGCLDRAEALPIPDSVERVVDGLMPLLEFMTSERYVFDVILRRSGAAALAEIGPIAQTFERQGAIVGGWLAMGPFRRDAPINILVEGVQAFAMQAMALYFCALHNRLPLRARFSPYLHAWLTPQVGVESLTAANPSG